MCNFIIAKPQCTCRLGEIVSASLWEFMAAQMYNGSGSGKDHVSFVCGYACRVDSALYRSQGSLMLESVRESANGMLVISS